MTSNFPNDFTSSIRTHCKHAMQLQPDDRSRYLKELELTEPKLFDQVNRLVEHRFELERRGVFGSLTLSDPFEIMQELGRGAHSTVYQARHRIRDKIVALKLLNSDADAQRFLVEVRASTKLDHRNIAKVYDCGILKGKPYLAMELIEGRPLSACLGQFKNDFMAIATLLRSVAEGVGFAHSKGVVHRDIKPSNILLADNGVPAIIDFGCAKDAEQELQLTQDGHVIGTPMYMSPEQLHGQHREIGPRSDVFALGIILYEMLTQRHPFESLSPLERVRLNRPTKRPRSVNHEIPEKLEAVCLKCIEANPEHRYASGTELCQDLEAFLAGDPVSCQRFYRTRYWVRRMEKPVSRIVVVLTLLFVLLWPLSYASAPTIAYWSQALWDNMLVSEDSIDLNLPSDHWALQSRRAEAKERQLERAKARYEHYRKLYEDEKAKIDSGEYDTGLSMWNRPRFVRQNGDRLVFPDGSSLPVKTGFPSLDRLNVEQWTRDEASGKKYPAIFPGQNDSPTGP